MLEYVKPEIAVEPEPLAVELEPPLLLQLYVTLNCHYYMPKGSIGLKFMGPLLLLLLL